MELLGRNLEEFRLECPSEKVRYAVSLMFARTHFVQQRRKYCTRLWLYLEPFCVRGSFANAPPGLPPVHHRARAG